MLRSQRRLLALIGALPVLVVLSALAYMVGMARLEGDPRTFWGALEWAAETISTTGYGADARWSNPWMVVFVVIVQFLGVFLIFLVFPIYLIPFLEERFEVRLPKEAPPLEDHVVIFQYGPAVETLIDELEHAGVETLVVEADDGRARKLVEGGHRVVFGTVDEGVLDRARLLQARSLIANAADDEDAALILAARQMGYRGEALALVEEPFHRRPIQLAGATATYTPRHILGAALAARASRRVSPSVAGHQQLGRRLRLREVLVTRDSTLAGKTLAEVGLGARTGVTVIGQWVGGRLLTPPTAEMRLEPNGILVLVGSEESLERFAQVCTEATPLRQRGPFVVGGFGEVGRKVVQILEDAGEEVRVIDRQQSPGVHVVGDVLDPAVLKRAEVGSAQGVILAVDADSVTMFAAVIVKDLAPEVPVIARVNRAENVERIHRAGAEFALSISQVSGQLLARRLLGEEAIEIDAQLKLLRVSARGLDGRHPADLDVRQRTGCSVVAVERSDELVVEFGPEFRFEAGDAVYVCGSSEATRLYTETFPQA